MLGSIGEQTAVASAKRAARGDFSDGAKVDEPDKESVDAVRGREVIVTVLTRLSWLSDISSGMRFAENDVVKKAE